jgi:hypothetical protein
LVLARAVLAVLTLASALYTAACADAIVAAGLVEVAEPDDPVPDAPEPVEPPPPDGAAADVVGALIVVGATVVDLVVVVGAVAVVVGLVVVVLGTVLVFDTNSVVPAPEPVLRLAVVVVELVVEVELACAVLSWSSAETRLCSAWLSESCAEVESSVPRSWPLVTCWPALTLTLESVPLVWKFTLRSAPAATLPVPETVACTIPFSAVRICVEVRAELVGAPIWATARAAIAIAATAST